MKNYPYFFGEEDYASQMHGVVAEFLKETVKEDFFKSFDGSKMHYYYAIHPEERAAVVISHGFCEFFVKYHEIAYYFYQMGYSIFFIDHRGHGYSHRDVKDWGMVYINSYDQYVEDFKCLMDQVVTKKSISKRYFLYAHSMGGAIATLFLEQYPKYFEKAVLSSPLMQMNFGSIPRIAVSAMVLWSKIARWDKKYAPGQTGYDGKYVFSESSMSSEPRYAYTFDARERVSEFQMYGGCYAWVRASVAATRKLQKNAAKVQIPVLLFQAGKDTMVKPKGQNRFVKHSKNTRVIRFANSKHEIFNTTETERKQYFQKIFDFLAE